MKKEMKKFEHADKNMKDVKEKEKKEGKRLVKEEKGRDKGMKNADMVQEKYKKMKK